MRVAQFFCAADWRRIDARAEYPAHRRHRRCGFDCVKAARLAAEHIDAGGGLRDSLGIAWRPLIVDTPADSMDIAVANMSQARVIAALGPDSANLIRRYLTQLQGLGVPVFTAAADYALLWRDDSQRIFRSRAQSKRSG